MPENNVQSWLFIILRNIWLNQLRERRTAPQVVEMDLDESKAGVSVDVSHNPHAIYVSEKERNLVREAIQRLRLSFAKLFCCASTKVCLIRKSPLFSIAQW